MTERLRQILKRYWGYDDFRPLQLETIESVCAGRDTLVLMPTGGGKSVIYQVPGLALDGVCIVVTPLIALMKDQIDQLRRRRILAESIHSGMQPRDIDRILDNCVYGDVKFLYIAPERIDSELFRTRFAKMRVSLLAVAAGLTAARCRRVSLPLLAAVVLGYQAIGTLGEWAMTGSLRAALQDFRIGLPGMSLQILGGWAFMRWILRR